MEGDIGDNFRSILERLWVINRDENFHSENDDNEIKPYTVDGIPIRKLFITNLAHRTTHKDLHKLFSEYGKITSYYLKRNTGKTNYAFVTFENKEDCLKALEAGQKKRIHIHHRDLRVLPADSWHQPDSFENQKKRTLSTEECNGFILNEEAEIHNLNDDCLIHIFHFLPIVDKIRVELVCSRWHSLCQQSWRSCKKIDLSTKTWGFKKTDEWGSSCQIHTPMLRQVLTRCGQFLNTINFSQHDHKLSKSTLTIVAKLCPNLQNIDVTALMVTPSGIQALKNNCSNILNFNLGHTTSACDLDLSQLFSKNQKLTSLKIESNVLTGNCLINLPVDSITRLDIHDCMNISCGHLLKALPNLHKLSIFKTSNCQNFDDTFTKAIGMCINLKELYMNGNFPLITPAGLKNIAKLRNIEILDVSNNIIIKDEFLKAVGINCKQLKKLDLSSCIYVTNVGVTSISHLPKLEELKVSYLPSITDEALSDMPNLKTCECRACPNVADKGLSNLIEISHEIQTIDVSGCKSITNDFVTAAIKATRNRTNNKILKIYVGHSSIRCNEINDVSPLLQVLNVDLSKQSILADDFDYFATEPYYIDGILDDDSSYGIDDDFDDIEGIDEIYYDMYMLGDNVSINGDDGPFWFG